MEADISIWRKPGHFYFALTPSRHKVALKRAACRAAGDLRSRSATRLRSNTRRSCVAATTSPHRKVGLFFRAEFFNIFKHPDFGSPNNDLISPLFGHSAQTLASFLGSGGANGGFNPLYQIGGPRSIQLALKLQF